MRARRGYRAACALLVALAAALTACGGGGDDRRPTGAPAAADGGRPAENPPPLRTNAVARALAPGLVRFEDLPAGWRAGREAAGAPEDTDFCGANLAAIERQGEKLGEAGAAFERGEAGPYLVETIAAYPPGAAARAMADLAAATATCREASIRDEEGGTNRWQLAPIPVPPFGDQTLALREYWPPNAVEALVVYVRRGDRIMTLVAVAVNARVDRLQLETLVGRAYERFLRLDAGR